MLNEILLSLSLLRLLLDLIMVILNIQLDHPVPYYFLSIRLKIIDKFLIVLLLTCFDLKLMPRIILWNSFCKKSLGKLI